MRAVVVTRHGGPEVLRVQERPDPRPGPGEVLIAVRAAGVNFADALARCGRYPAAPKPPCVLGYEVAGEIAEVGRDVTGLSVGDRVVAATRFGGQAELVAVPASYVFPLAAGASFEEGAALLVNYATAYAALMVLGGAREGERLLIQGAGGGVGLAAAQIARQAGVEVIGAAAPFKHDAIRAHGVTHPIDSRAGDLKRRVLELTAGEGVDVAIDAAGPKSFRTSYGLLRPGGRLVMIGYYAAADRGLRATLSLVRSVATWPLATMPWWSFVTVLRQNRAVAGLDLLAWWDSERDGAVAHSALLPRLSGPVLRLLAHDAIRPVVHASVPFADAPEAHVILHERRNIGKVVLAP